MTRCIILLAVALSLTTVAGAPIAAAHGGCEHPADGVSVCETNDNDDTPDLVVAETGAEGLGSATVVAQDEDTDFFTHRSVEATATSSEDSPIGENAAEARAGCSQGFNEEEPCNDGRAGVVLEDDVDSRLVVGADCNDAFTGATPACDYGAVGIDGRDDGQGIRAVYICGGVGFFANPCPLEHSFGLDADTDQGDAAVFGGYTPVFGAGACSDDPATGGTCLP
jgi:hypothetical protein